MAARVELWLDILMLTSIAMSMISVSVLFIRLQIDTALTLEYTEPDYLKNVVTKNGYTAMNPGEQDA